MSCSLDHYGERAEWLRHGTEWDKVERNLEEFRKLDYVHFQINTVFSIFNYLTIGEFFDYLISKNLIRNNDWYNSLYLAVHPSYYSAKSLPIELKKEAEARANEFIARRQEKFPTIARLVRDAVNFANESHTWKDNKDTFFKHTLSIDRIRQESFYQTFPELNKLLTLTE